MTAPNIGKISLTGLCDLCGAFSLDRCRNRFLQGMSFSVSMGPNDLHPTDLIFMITSTVYLISTHKKLYFFSKIIKEPNLFTSSNPLSR